MLSFSSVRLISSATHAKPLLMRVPEYVEVSTISTFVWKPPHYKTRTYKRENTDFSFNRTLLVGLIQLKGGAELDNPAKCFINC
jgi:hypothetical protein